MTTSSAASASPEPAPSLSRPEILGMLESWIQADPDLSFAQAKRDAEKLGFKLTASLMTEARSRMGLARPLRPSVHRPAQEKTSVPKKELSPIMAFAVEFLTADPTASFATVKEEIGRAHV